MCFRLLLFSDINVSQGSVATFVRCGGLFNLVLLTIYCWVQWWKKNWKSVSIWQSYGQKYSSPIFSGHGVCTKLTTTVEQRNLDLCYCIRSTENESSLYTVPLCSIYGFRQRVGLHWIESQSFPGFWEKTLQVIWIIDNFHYDWWLIHLLGLIFI